VDCGAIHPKALKVEQVQRWAGGRGREGKGRKKNDVKLEILQGHSGEDF
jgi:hypothetical protein